MNKHVLLILAMFISAALLQPCAAKTASILARFDGTAIGECYVGIEWAPGPDPPIAAFLGEGAVRVRGSCAVDEYPPNANIPSTYYYAAEGAKASGMLLAKWDDQMICVSMHSEDSTCGFFIDQGDVNYFIIGGLPGGQQWILSLTLTYKGVYKDQSGIHTVSGKCGVFAAPIGDPATAVVAMGAVLLRQDTTPLLSLIWFPYDVLGLPLSIDVHAADPFVHSVEIITKP